MMARSTRRTLPEQICWSSWARPWTWERWKVQSTSSFILTSMSTSSAILWVFLSVFFQYWKYRVNSLPTILRSDGPSIQDSCPCCISAWMVLCHTQTYISCVHMCTSDLFLSFHADSIFWCIIFFFGCLYVEIQYSETLWKWYQHKIMIITLRILFPVAEPSGQWLAMCHKRFVTGIESVKHITPSCNCSIIALNAALSSILWWHWMQHSLWSDCLEIAVFTMLAEVLHSPYLNSSSAVICFPGTCYGCCFFQLCRHGPNTFWLNTVGELE